MFTTDHKTPGLDAELLARLNAIGGGATASHSATTTTELVPAPGVSIPGVTREVLKLGPGERAFSEVFGLDCVLKDYAVKQYEDDKWDMLSRSMIPDPDPHYVFPAGITEIVVAAMMRGKRSQLIHGPKGSGKSSLTEQVCARLRVPFWRVNMAEDAEGSRLFGGPTVSKGEVVWAAGPAEQAALATYDGTVIGGVLQVDEVSSSPAGVNLNMQWMLETNGKIMLSEKPSGERMIRPGSMFHVVCTDNTVLQGDTTGRYAGTNVQNEAFLDRMSVVSYLGYVDAKHEIAILKNKCGVGAKEAGNMRKVAGMIRAAYDSGKLNFNISPRGLIDWADEANFWGSTKAGFTNTFLHKLLPEDKEAVREMYFKVYGDKL